MADVCIVQPHIILELIVARQLTQYARGEALDGERRREREREKCAYGNRVTRVSASVYK